MFMPELQATDIQSSNEEFLWKIVLLRYRLCSFLIQGFGPRPVSEPDGHGSNFPIFSAKPFAMPSFRYLLTAAVIFSLTVTSRAQTAGWKSVTYGKASLHYPPTWHLTRDSRGTQTRISLTPDSMQNLSMRMIEMYELPSNAEHNYAFFKANFTELIKNGTSSDAKFLKMEEMSFKGHKCMHAEIISGSLPSSVYGIDAGADIYLILVTKRRYSQVADPGLDRDGTAILNSISFAQ